MKAYLNRTDEELLALLKEGSQQAFEAIYRRYASPLYAYINSRIRQTEDSRELIQEIFESMWLRRESLNVASLKHYLFSAVRFMTFRYIHKKGLRERYAQHFVLFETAWYTLEDPDHDKYTLRDKIFKALHGLPERCQLAVKMRLSENLSNSEIAERMNITRKTVEVYMSRAMSHLRVTLKSAVTALVMLVFG